MPKVNNIKDAVRVMLSPEERVMAKEDRDEDKLFHLEADLQSFILTEKAPLIEAYDLCMFIKHSDRLITGIPDLQIFTGNGQSFFIELKRSEKDAPRKTQTRFHAKLEQFGCKVYIAWTWGMVKDILHEQGIPVYGMFPSTKGVELGEYKKKERR